jgi:hypothetical protein
MVSSISRLAEKAFARREVSGVGIGLGRPDGPRGEQGRSNIARAGESLTLTEQETAAQQPRRSHKKSTRRVTTPFWSRTRHAKLTVEESGPAIAIDRFGGPPAGWVSRQHSARCFRSPSPHVDSYELIDR